MKGRGVPRLDVSSSFAGPTQNIPTVSRPMAVDSPPAGELVEVSNSATSQSASVSSRTLNVRSPEEYEAAITAAKVKNKRHIQRTVKCFDWAFGIVGESLYSGTGWEYLHKNIDDLSLFNHGELKKIRDEVREFVDEQTNREAELKALSDNGWA